MYKQDIIKSLQGISVKFALSNHGFIEKFSNGEFSQDAIRWWAIKMLPGSNRFNQAFLKVAAKMDNCNARTIMLKNIYTEHGCLDSEKAHVNLFKQFMQGINCQRIDIHEDDYSFSVPELRFKRFEISDSEPIIWSLGRFLAIENVLPSIFQKYIVGLKKIFVNIDDSVLEYFYIHCELDPEHTEDLINVALMYIKSEQDLTILNDGISDMLLSISDMFSWMYIHLQEGKYEAENIKISYSSDKSFSELLVHDRTLYKEQAKLYDSIYYRESMYNDQVEFISALVKTSDLSQMKVLDLCCGTGTHAKFFSDKGYLVTGVDISEEMLSIAKEKAKNVKFINADIRDFSLSETFDLVLCMYGAIHYIESSPDTLSVLRNAFSHLKKGGCLVVELRDTNKLPEDNALDWSHGYYNRKFFLRQRGINHSDLYVVTAFNQDEHFLEIHNLFNTDSYKFHDWCRIVGFEDVKLYSNYKKNEPYSEKSQSDIITLVAKK